MVKVKFCGMKRLGDALDAARLGVHALGFVFVKGSKRFIEPQHARQIIQKLPPFVLKVGVFANPSEDEVRKIADMCKLDVIQLHGDEDIEFCKKLKEDFRIIKALRVKDESVLEEIPRFNFVDAILLDTYEKDELGGTGKSFEWSIARRARDFDIPIILSGGLKPENVKEAIREVNPYAVDVSSGIEKEPGIKDHELMAKFIACVWEEEWGL
jgi:phosphoribosylanthranilate isomerase